MAKKLKRKVIGQVVKSKDPSRSNYMKFNLYQTGGSLTIKDGQILSVESKKYQLDSLNKAISEGKISSDVGQSIKERIEGMPEWVLGDIVFLSEE